MGFSTPNTTIGRGFSEVIAMTPTIIKDLFASDISRRIEEVIKVDQADEQIIHEELSNTSLPTRSVLISRRFWIATGRRPTNRTKVLVSGSRASSDPASQVSRNTSDSALRIARF